MLARLRERARAGGLMGEPPSITAATGEYDVPHTPAIGRVGRERLLVVLCLLLGGLLRGWDLPAMEFKNDEQEALNAGIRLLENRPWSTEAPWPQTGLPSSGDVANPPLFAWVMALAWALAEDAVGATALVALANWLCLVPLYLWARRRLGRERALLFLAVMCVSPFAVFYSRKLWAQDLLLPALTLLLWGVEWMRADRTFWRGVACVVWAALPISQLHQSGPIALAMALPAALVQAMYEKTHGRAARPERPGLVSSLAIVFGTAAFLFFWVPYLGYLGSLPADALSDRPTVAIWRAELLRRVAFQLVPRDLVWFFGEDMRYFLSESHYGSAALALRLVGYYGAFATGLVAGSYGLYRWAVSPFSVPFFGLWWIGIILAFTLARIPSYPHYVLTLAPLPALLISGAFDPRRSTSWLRSMRWVRAAHVGCLALMTTGTLLWLSARGGSSGDYGVAYRIRLEQAQAIAAGQTARGGASQEPGCAPVPSELRWILTHRLHAGAVPGTVRLCDAWLDHATHREYEWTLRR